MKAPLLVIIMGDDHHDMVIIMTSWWTSWHHCDHHGPIMMIRSVSEWPTTKVEPSWCQLTSWSSRSADRWSSDLSHLLGIPCSSAGGLSACDDRYFQLMLFFICCIRLYIISWSLSASSWCHDHHVFHDDHKLPKVEHYSDHEGHQKLDLLMNFKCAHQCPSPQAPNPKCRFLEGSETSEVFGLKLII